MSTPTSATLDPEISALTDVVQIPDINGEILTEFRSSTIGVPADLSDRVERTEHVVTSNPDVSVRVHRPVGVTGPLPCLYTIHGGGYVIGGPDMDDKKLDQWCPEFGIVGVSVRYRLAPETPYPGPLDDCYAGLKWVVDNADDIGVDATKIGITGVSAGGGLCAALAILARDRGEIDIQFQLLDCPMIDDRQITPSSQIDDLEIWSKASNAFGWQSYLGDLSGTDHIPALAAPARADDLSGLPEAYVCVGGADGFRDEDITYAMRLSGAGVSTELHVYPGAPHGVALFVGTEVARRYTADQTDWLRRQFSRLK